MANMVQSLFGLTPEQVGLQEEAQRQQTALDIARLDPFQAAKYSIGLGASQLGTGIARAMGYESPAMKQAKERQGLLSGMSIQDPAALKDAAQKAWNAGQFDVAQNLLKTAQEMEAEQSKQAKEAAMAKYYLGEGKQGTGKAGGGTGPERMAQFISDVNKKIRLGETVTPEEVQMATNFQAILSQQKIFFDQNTGQILSAPQREISGVVATQETPAASTTTQPTVPTVKQSQAGVKAFETPRSVEIKQKESEASDMAVQRLNDGLTNINVALGTLSSFTANPWVQGITKQFPTEGRVLDNAIKAINSTKTIDLITQMKQQSKTGATGFGSVTEKELDLLQSDIVKLDPQSPTIKQDLGRVATRWNSLIAKIQSSGGTLPAASSTPSASSQSFNAQQRSRIDAAKKKYPGYTEEQIIQALKGRGLI
jgi:hypothetical protein